MSEKYDMKFTDWCPECGGDEMTLKSTEGYYDTWACSKCGHDFKRHVTWKEGRPPHEIPGLRDNVVELSLPSSEEEPLNFHIGPQTIQKDITPYETSMLLLLILRVFGDTPTFRKDLDDYPEEILRHIVID